jgi:hypothetical protein
MSDWTCTNYIVTRPDGGTIEVCATHVVMDGAVLRMHYAPMGREPSEQTEILVINGGTYEEVTDG